MLQIIIIVLAVAADQITKALIAGWLRPNETYPLIPGVLHFTHVENRGIAMGLFQDSQIPVIILTFLILIGGAFYLIRERRNKSLLFRISASLIVGGAIGNLIDRLTMFKVIDFIDVRAINFYVFNVSDSCTCVGAALLAVYLIFYSDLRKKTVKENHE